MDKCLLFFSSNKSTLTFTFTLLNKFKSPIHAGNWTLTTGDGKQTVAKYVVMATGALSHPNVVNLPGESEYRGRVIRSNKWPKEVTDFTGRKVAVIGTGSTGIQTIPQVNNFFLFLEQRNARQECFLGVSNFCVKNYGISLIIFRFLPECQNKGCQSRGLKIFGLPEKNTLFPVKNVRP